MRTNRASVKIATASHSSILPLALRRIFEAANCSINTGKVELTGMSSISIQVVDLAFDDSSTVAQSEAKSIAMQKIVDADRKLAAEC